MPKGQELERLRPQEQALIRVADGLGIVTRDDSGAIMIDLANPKLKEQYNVLAPATTIFKADPNFTPAISIISLDTKDFYPTSKGQEARYALSKVQLDQIAKVAGIEDESPDIVYFGHDNQNLRITWSARMRRPDGTWQRGTGSREWIEADEMDKLLSSVPDYVTKVGPPDRSNPKFNEWWAQNWYDRVKKHRMGMTETKARLRAYRSLLTVKGNYAKDELRKPFLIASTSFTPDTSDLRILGMLMTGGQEASNMLYGEARQLGAGSEDMGSFEVMEGDDDAPAGVDPETGEIIEEGEVVEEAETEADEPKTFGEKPETDLEIPRGPHKGKMLSELVRTERKYVEETILKSSNPSWGMCAEAWLRYTYGDAEGGDGVDF